MILNIKRIYDEPSGSDGVRVLVDRLWPRGIKKKDSEIHHWFKELAPSGELRRWFDHDPDKWNEFKRRYFIELEANKKSLSELMKLADNNRITLLYGSRETSFNNAVALREYVLKYNEKI